MQRWKKHKRGTLVLREIIAPSSGTRYQKGSRNLMRNNLHKEQARCIL